MTLSEAKKLVRKLDKLSERAHEHKGGDERWIDVSAAIDEAVGRARRIMRDMGK